jgi:hypothetical protein
VLASAVAAAAAIATLSLALLELAHRAVDERTAVRAFTVYDVVGSTSLQIGLFTGGLVIAVADRTTGWPVDLYRLHLLVCATLILFATRRLPRRGAGESRRS